MDNSRHIETDLLIIGSGMAGMTAALFAANRGIDCVLSGGAGGFEYSSGLMDLWGASINRDGHISKKPWDMLLKVHETMPDHPYSMLNNNILANAFSELIHSLKGKGITYTGYNALNSIIMTPFGTLRPTYRLPVTMASNREAFKTKPPCLVLDFKGLREFSAVFFKETMKKNWPGLRTRCLEFPGIGPRPEVYTPFLARAFETEETQEKFIRLVKPHLKDASYLGIPAILGVYSTDKILACLEKELNVKIFEIPTSPISVPGIRLKEAMSRVLENSSVTILPNKRVTKVLNISKKGLDCELGSGTLPVTVHAKAGLLATGRFLGRGLYADRTEIHESIFNLPVSQPEKRTKWHNPDFFSLKGHRINRAGIKTDTIFRPAKKNGKPVYENLFASGSILACQNWMREKCGAGLSIGTSFAAITAISDNKII